MGVAEVSAALVGAALGGAAPNAATDGAVMLQWAILITLLAAVVAVAAAGGSCLAAALAAGVARARARRKQRAAAAGAPGSAAAPFKAPPSPLPPFSGARHQHQQRTWAAWMLGRSHAPVNGHHANGVPVNGAAAADAHANKLLLPLPPVASHPLDLDSDDEAEGTFWYDSAAPTAAAAPVIPPLALPAVAAAAVAAAAEATMAAAGAAPPSVITAAGAAGAGRASLAARARARLAHAFSPLLRAADNAVALVASLPRTARTLTWAVRVGISYKRFLGRADPLMDPEGYQRGLSELHDYWAERLTEVCRHNGGVYIKAGQFAAAFSSVPPEYRKHLALLQDKAKPRPFSTVERVVRCELGASVEEVFSEFSAEATAAASLAQVHKARLYDGSEVAVKIQYPGLRGAADADLTTLALLSDVAVAAFPDFNLGWLHKELRHKLEEELDFNVEIAHSTKLLSMLSKGHGVVVPRIHRPLCTSKILVMEWISGVKINDARALRRARISPHAVGLQLETAFAEMTFVHGYLHADPHPGNIMVRPAGRRSLASYVASGSWQPFEVVLLDHGCYLSLNPHTRTVYCQLWTSLFAGDRVGAAQAAIELGGQRAGQILPIILYQRARTKQEREDMQKAAGVSSFTDISNLLNTAPREVVELLRITAVIRSVTGPLGTTRAERLRLNGSYALRGIPSLAPLVAPPCSGVSGGGAPPGASGGGNGAEGGGSGGGDGRGSALAYRLRVESRLALIRGYVFTNTLLMRVLLATLHVFGQNVPLS